MASIERLLDIMATLRDTGSGCPWDREQTWRSLVPHTLEEAYEVADAAEAGHGGALCDELGDLLFQVVFYARIGAEEGSFDFDDIVVAICEKLTRRHPHVFGDAVEPDAASQAQSWEAIKAAERAGATDTPGSSMDDVPLALPGLSRAAKLQRRASRVGFDWPDREPVVAKVREEVAEVEAAIADGDEEAARAEVGDVLFAVANLARHLNADPEQRIRDTNAKFERRFRAFEAALRAQGIEPVQAGFEAMEAAYQQVKAAERG